MWIESMCAMEEIVVYFEKHVYGSQLLVIVYV